MSTAADPVSVLPVLILWFDASHPSHVRAIVGQHPETCPLLVMPSDASDRARGFGFVVFRDWATARELSGELMSFGYSSALFRLSKEVPRLNASFVAVGRRIGGTGRLLGKEGARRLAEYAAWVLEMLRPVVCPFADSIVSSCEAWAEPPAIRCRPNSVLVTFGHGHPDGLILAFLSICRCVTLDGGRVAGFCARGGTFL